MAKVCDAAVLVMMVAALAVSVRSSPAVDVASAIVMEEPTAPVVALANEVTSDGPNLGDPDVTISGTRDLPTSADDNVMLSDQQSLGNTCTANYRADHGHTMCLQDSPLVTGWGMTSRDKQLVVDLHNQLRGEVMPSPADLAVLVWDDRLAAVAAKWARQCTMGHDKKRNVPEYGMNVGQNVAGGYHSWRTVVMAWWDEIKLYHFGVEPNSYLGYPDGWKKIGHYTQMVQNTTYRLGCGYASCRNSQYGRYYVCNYAWAQSRLEVPYTRGARCGACPHNCVQGLCDCKGRMCLNGGTLDPATCQCSCPSIYAGADCSSLNCPAKDPFYCGRDLPPSTCTKYANGPQLCPYMCGVCGRGNAGLTGGSDRPGGNNRPQPPPATPAPDFVSAFGCRYKGKRASPEECRAYGDKGNDMGFCASMGGRTGCSDCQRFYNIKTDYCPVMCGLCDAPCNGKKCENGGHLDTDTCQCQCKPPFTGSTCQAANCPTKDPFHCVVYPPSYCKVYVNVPEECPHLCKIC